MSEILNYQIIAFEGGKEDRILAPGIHTHGPIEVSVAPDGTPLFIQPPIGKYTPNERKVVTNGFNNSFAIIVQPLTKQPNL